MILMIVSITLNYAVGTQLENRAQHPTRKLILTIGVALNLAILIAFKYANFINVNINLLLSFVGLPQWDLQPVHLPLGISFFTFQAISYLIDISRGEIRVQRRLINLGLYIAMFPQLIAGPIVRYKTINREIDNRRVSPELFASGVERFILGLSKKMLIANPLGAVVDAIFSLPVESIPTHVAWFGILLYALQIYFDFSGYSDMAIGLGRMFGFRFLENFNYPYIAQSLQDFWRRWHISLSTWFRDYLYIPLGGNRLSPIRTYLNLFCVFILCGMWHGASWNFIVWGALHGIVLAFERAGFSTILSRLWRPVRHLYLILVVLISWVFFRADDLTIAVQYLQRMFAFDFSSVPFEFLDALNVEVALALVFGLLFSGPLLAFFWPNHMRPNMEAPGIKSLALNTSKSILLLGFFLLCAMQLAASTHNPFIYFRF